MANQRRVDHMPKHFDLSDGNGWGRAIYLVSERANGDFVVSGCLTPLPEPGDTVTAHNGALCRFIEVEPMGNPRDGFMADVRIES